MGLGYVVLSLSGFMAVIQPFGSWLPGRKVVVFSVYMVCIAQQGGTETSRYQSSGSVVFPW